MDPTASSSSSESSLPGRSPAAAKVLIATTVALTFISFWRGAAIVLSDLASTMFYVGGIAEQAIGKSAPWFVLAVMLLSFAVRSIYLESCGMYVRGGVYVVVRDSMGPGLAKVSVSALVVDYLLTGPISSVSAGQYLGRLFNELSELAGQEARVDPQVFAMFLGVLVTLYFWRGNVRGIHESSGRALRIMQITTIMVAALLIWCPLTLLLRGNVQFPPAPTLGNLTFTSESLGWLDGTFWAKLALVGIFIALGHSVLAMSGFETLAQVYREIAHPKMKNLRMAANLVCGYAVVSTGLITLFAVMIIPDDTRSLYYDNLIGGLSMNLAGPYGLRLAFHVFVVIVGTMILSGAVNTSLIGANGILNRVAEDGVLLGWFRKPHLRFGTTHRIIGLIALAQVATIIGSRGDVYLLGEAYAFGVIWSFVLKGLGVLVLRFRRHDQEYKTPLNLTVGGHEIPVGLFLTTSALLLVAIANLLTKQIATIYGISCTVILVVLFTVSETVNRRSATKERPLEEFNLEFQSETTPESVHARPGCVLVAVRDYRNLYPLRATLETTGISRHDVVVMTVHPVTTGTAEHDLRNDQLFGQYERDLFSRVVTVAEKAGKPVQLLVVPAVDPFDAVVRTAANIQASRLVSGVSKNMSPEALARRIGLAWEKLPKERHAFSLEVIGPDQIARQFVLGPHPPKLWPEDVERLHRLWTHLSDDRLVGGQLHHRDVVGFALHRLEQDLSTDRANGVVDELSRYADRKSRNGAKE